MAMNKKEFVKELRRNMQGISFEEQEDAIAYYEEYIDEGGIENEEATIKSLGDPKEIAKKIRLDNALKKPAKNSREGISKLWVVILAIFAAPMALPLIAGMFGLLISLVVTGAALIVSPAIVVVSTIVAGISSILIGVTLIPASFATFVSMFGGGLLLIGIGLFFAVLTDIVARFLIEIFRKLFVGTFNRLTKRGA